MAGSKGRLPEGIVTFVFSDIEGSTRLIHRLGESYADVLERHRAILRRAWSEHDGHEISVDGDAFFVAFAEPDDAIAACVTGQRALAAENWPGGTTLRVREGIHSGLASPRDGNYVSLAVHQAKRVVDASHGGQILVSQQAADLASPDGGLNLRPLGRFRLRDFAEPVRLYQVVGEGLLDDFAAIRAVPAEGHNIVRPSTSTVGREEAVAAVASRVVPRHTVTLTGPGGVGKSRLASEVGVAIAPQWVDGVWFVDLSVVRDPGLVPSAVAMVIGAASDPTRARADDVLRHLETRGAVVILDNCEHVAAACRDLTGAIHDVCPGVGIMATSREPLRSAGEFVWPVDPLAAPTGSRPRAADVLASPAGRLFLERGVSVRPTFVVDDDNAAAVAEICRYLDGIPLFIELAAAHLSHQSPAEILTGLEDRLRLLRSHDPRLSPRHQTVEGLLDWSYQLLSRRERAALRSLAVFAGSFSLHTGPAAVADEEIAAEDVPELIWSLVDRSLVSADLAVSATRYRLLGTVRTYARRLLDEQGVTGPVATRVGEWFMSRVGPWIPQDRGWVGEVDLEVDNLRGLIPLIPAGHHELAQQIACTIGLYHEAQQTFRDGIDELTRLARLLDQPSSTRVSLLTILSYQYLRTGQIDRAVDLAEMAVGLRAEHGAPEWDDVGVDRILGDIKQRSGDPLGAVEIARRALDLPLSDRGQARMYNLLGISSAAVGDLETAYEACRRELELNEALGLDGFVASAHGNLAEVALRRGDMPAAARHQRESLDLGVAQGSSAMVAFSLIVAARIAAWAGDWPMAGYLHARGEVLLDEIGLVLYPDDQRESEELLLRTREQLGDGEYAASLERGRAMAIPTAVDRAKEVLLAASRMGDTA